MKRLFLKMSEENERHYRIVVLYRVLAGSLVRDVRKTSIAIDSDALRKALDVPETNYGIV